MSGEREVWVVAFVRPNGRISEMFPCGSEKEARQAKLDWDRQYTSSEEAVVYLARLDSGAAE